MSSPLFQIEKLSCSYSQDETKKVLYIDRLDIPRGKLVFLLGPSGSGKSTLLETLGLMNHTIAAGNLNFFPDSSGPAINFGELWKRGDENRLNEVRKNFFSFVFQHTNLMENFSAYENVSLSRMIKSDANEKDAGLAAAPLMNRVNLPQSLVNYETPAVQLSGGQKQRLAFVRALSSEYAVLFGDEPTGNLDPYNAHELFDVIRSHIGEKSSAIVVSHDLELAIRHADLIIVISKSENGNYGEVKPENIFFHEQISAFTDSERHQFKLKLLELFRIEETAGSESLQSYQAPVQNRSFKKLFFVKEAKALSGKYYTNFLILSCILLFTFLAIGFANGALDYLDKKLNNAFVNWLTISIPFGNDARETRKLESKLNSKDFRDRFHYQNATQFKESIFEIYDPREKISKYIQGRTLNARDKKFLDDYLLEPDNVIKDKMGTLLDKDLSIIILESALAENHYDKKNTDFVWFKSESKDGDRVFIVPIPVRSIVNQLPGNNQIAYSELFHRAFMFDTRNFNPETKHDLRIVLRHPADQAKAVKEEVDRWIVNNKSHLEFKPGEAELERYNETYNPYFQLRINFFPQPETPSFIDSVYRELTKLPLLKDSSTYSRIYDYSEIDWNAIGKFEREGKNDYFSVYFENLDSVRAFSDALYKETNLVEGEKQLIVDTSKITEKENFNFLSNVTKIIGALLVLFGAIAASLYCFNLLKMHLSKVQMNIGTFKALGLSNRRTLQIYFSIILFFVGIACLVSFVIAFMVGNVFDQVLSGSRSVEAGISYFKLLDVKTIYAVALILAGVIAISFFTITKMLSKTPGDLIYNR